MVDSVVPQLLRNMGISKLDLTDAFLCWPVHVRDYEVQVSSSAHGGVLPVQVHAFRLEAGARGPAAVGARHHGDHPPPGTAVSVSGMPSCAAWEPARLGGLPGRLRPRSRPQPE